MSDSWSETRAAWRKMRQVWDGADEDARHRLVYWIIGLLMIGSSIIAQFGYPGAVFCFGVILYAASQGGRK